MAGATQTISQYIVHHLTNLTYGKLPAGYEREDGSVIGEGAGRAARAPCVILSTPTHKASTGRLDVHHP